MEQHQYFTEGKIFLPLIRFALPVFLALLLQAMYGAVDLLVAANSAENWRMCTYPPYPPAASSCTPSPLWSPALLWV